MFSKSKWYLKWRRLQSTYPVGIQFSMPVKYPPAIQFHLFSREAKGKWLECGGATMLSELEKNNILFVTLHIHFYSLSQRIHRIHHLLGEWRWRVSLSHWCLCMDMVFLHIKISHFPPTHFDKWSPSMKNLYKICKTFNSGWCGEVVLMLTADEWEG